MKHYILISNTKEHLINKKLLDIISFQIEKFIDRKITFTELSIKQAYECEFFDREINIELKESIKNFLLKKNIDCNFVMPTKCRKKKLLLADMDSTIIKEESLDEIARKIGIEKDIIKITNDAMNGKIDFKLALKKRVAMLKGQPANLLYSLKKNININEGAKELINTMKQNGATTVLVSGGFTFLTEHLKTLLGFNYTHANSLEITTNKYKLNILTGKIQGVILDNKAKLKYLDKYVKDNALSYEDTICVGDGANDVEMIKKACLGISFNGKKILDETANVHFKNTNLKGLLYLQGYCDAEIT